MGSYGDDTDSIARPREQATDSSPAHVPLKDTAGDRSKPAIHAQGTAPLPKATDDAPLDQAQRGGASPGLLAIDRDQGGLAPAGGGSSQSVRLLERQVRTGMEAAHRLREVILPSLRSQLAGGHPPLHMAELEAWSALRQIAHALERTEMASGHQGFVGGLLEIPTELVNKRQQLMAEHAALKDQLTALSRAFADKIASSARSPSPAASRETPHSYTAHAAAPPTFDFGKVTPGTQGFLSLPIHNLTNRPAEVGVSYRGDPAVEIVSSPPHLSEAGTRVPDGVQNIKLVFTAPAKHGTHHGTLLIGLSWAGGPASEQLTVPVVGHSMDEQELTPDEKIADAHHRKQASDADIAERKRVARGEHELEAFDKKHPGHTNNLFIDAIRACDAAMGHLGEIQAGGIDDASKEVFKYVTAPPRPEQPGVMFELAMLVLDIATAGVAGALAKTLEAGLKQLAGLEAATIASMTDGLKETIKGSSKLVRKRLQSTAGGATPDEDHHAPSAGRSSDPRIAFFRALLDGNSEAEEVRMDALIHTQALLRPTLYKDPDLAIEAVKQITTAIHAEIKTANWTFASAAMRQWINYISDLKLGLNRVGSVGDSGIAGVRGVVDIGFQPGQSPHDRVIVKSATIRGISNDAAKRLVEQPLLGLGIPVRAYGLPTPNRAELLVTVTRTGDGTLDFIDESNGLAPGRGWLAQKGGTSSAGAKQLIEREIMNVSLNQHGVNLTTDQDPSLEARTGEEAIKMRPMK
jgi:hypothetical protein